MTDQTNLTGQQIFDGFEKLIRDPGLREELEQFIRTYPGHTLRYLEIVRSYTEQNLIKTQLIETLALKIIQDNKNVSK